MPLVSIIIDSYNHASWVRQAIDSALSQTAADVEVIVVDDGSTDGSRAVIAEYEDRARIVFKENAGQGSAYNAGFSASSGDLIIFVDSDDFLDPHAAARVAASWRPGVTKVQFRLRTIDGEGQPLGYLLPPENQPMPSESVREMLLQRGAYPSPPGSGNAYSRDLLQRILPMPERDWWICSDSYTSIAAGFLGEIVSLEETLGGYRIHRDNNWGWKRPEARKILNQVTFMRLREQEIRRHALALGIDLPERLPFDNVDYVYSPLALLLIAPELAVSAVPKLKELIGKGITTTLRDPWMSLPKRLLQTAWFASLPLLPRAVARDLMIWRLFPELRPTLFPRQAVSAPVSGSAS